MGSIALEEYDLLGDSKYRRWWGILLGVLSSLLLCLPPPSYMTQVDRALRGFESTSEWADLIAALTKLNRWWFPCQFKPLCHVFTITRVLLAHMKYPVVPRRVNILTLSASQVDQHLSGCDIKEACPMHAPSSAIWGSSKSIGNLWYNLQMYGHK